MLPSDLKKNCIANGVFWINLDHQLRDTISQILSNIFHSSPATYFSHREYVGLVFFRRRDKEGVLLKKKGGGGSAFKKRGGGLDYRGNKIHCHCHCPINFDKFWKSPFFDYGLFWEKFMRITYNSAYDILGTVQPDNETLIRIWIICIQKVPLLEIAPFFAF